MILQALPLLVGFSIGAAVVLAAAFATGYRDADLPWPSRVAGFVMLAGLALTQFAHLEATTRAGGWLPTRGYVVVIFLQSLGFYWLLLGALRPARDWSWRDWLLPPATLAIALAIPLAWAIPVALAGGTAAVSHLGLLVHRLRAMRRWFALELRVLVAFAAMALVVAAAGVQASVGGGWMGYAAIYTALIAIGFGLVAWLLLVVPDLVPKTREAVAVAYAQSTLGKVDRDAAAARLRRLFDEERVHRDDSLSLATVAEMLGLSGHQLSELVNTEFGMGFPRLVRQYRVRDAERMLVDEPRASVLSVGLAAGFSSQSTFYVAFKELVGEVPGAYRQRLLARLEGPRAPE